MFFMKKKNWEHNMDITADIQRHKELSKKMMETDFDQDLPEIKSHTDFTEAEKSEIVELIILFIKFYSCELRNFQKTVCSDTQAIYGYKKTGIHKQMGKIENQEWLKDVTEAFHTIPEVLLYIQKNCWDDFKLQLLYQSLKDFSELWYEPLRNRSVSWFIQEALGCHGNSYRMAQEIMTMLRKNVTEPSVKEER